jgi:hypothetical protein
MAQVPILPADFVDLLTEFADAEVQHLVIGGYAVGFHDRPRATKDLDFSAAYKRHSTMKAGALIVQQLLPNCATDHKRKTRSQRLANSAFSFFVAWAQLDFPAQQFQDGAEVATRARLPFCPTRSFVQSWTLQHRYQALRRRGRTPHGSLASERAPEKPHTLGG